MPPTPLFTRLASFKSELPRVYWYLWMGTLVNRLGGFVVPFLALYLTSRRGIVIGQAALVVSLFGAGSLLASLVGGELSDRLGRRPVLLASFFVAPVVAVTVGVAQSLPVIAAATFVYGFFCDLYRPAVSAAVADLVPSERRVRAFSYLYWAINLGAAIAPVIAGFVAERTYLLLFVGDAATTAAFGLIVLLRVPETRPAKPQARQPKGGSRASLLLREPLLLGFAGLTLLSATVYAQSTSTLPIAMHLSGVGPAGYGIAIALNGLLIVLLSLPLSRALERWPRFLAMAVAALLLGVGFGSTQFARFLPVYGLTVALWTIGEIFSASVAPAIVADLATPELRGLYQGVYGSAWGLSFLVGPALGGFVLDRYGSLHLWTGCFVLCLAAAAGYLAMSRSMARRMQSR